MAVSFLLARQLICLVKLVLISRNLFRKQLFVKRMRNAKNVYLDQIGQKLFRVIQNANASTWNDQARFGSNTKR
ncbi:hypothetical protein SAMN03159376_04297 [Pseudomonas sp. NFACC09-4]|nr:hypothetical protein SAMN03159376_04297 [Pseudomonas sp. NFACC09-4]